MSPFSLPQASALLRLGIVAGELSGDALGAGLMRDLKKRYPHVEFLGIGGPQMQAEGLKSLFPLERLSVMGLVEVLGRLPELLKIRNSLLALFTEARITGFIGIDAPDFNLRMAAKLRPQGIKTVQYVSPSVWAWRQGRVVGIRQAVDLVLCLFPFEVDFYYKNAVPAVFVGHPLAHSMPLGHQGITGKRVFAIHPERRIVALLPGSRGGEVARLLPVLLEVAACLYALDSQLGFLIPAANAARDAQIRLQRDALPEPLRHVVRIIRPTADGKTGLQVMAASDVVVLASGTATLEALLLTRPMVVVYRVHWLTYWLAKHLVKIAHVALPNILAGREIVPELIQHNATVEHITQAVWALLAEPAQYAAQQTHLTEVHAMLQSNQAVSAAQAVLDLILPTLTQ